MFWKISVLQARATVGWAREVSVMNKNINHSKHLLPNQWEKKFQIIFSCKISLGFPSQRQCSVCCRFWVRIGYWRIVETVEATDHSIKVIGETGKVLAYFVSFLIHKRSTYISDIISFRFWSQAEAPLRKFNLIFAAWDWNW